MSILASKKERPRIAALVGHRHPDAAHAWIYDEQSRLAEALRADWCAFYGEPADPRGLTGALRRRLGEGIQVPGIRALHADAAEHFRYAEPQRFAGLLEDLQQACGGSAAAVLLRPEVQMAFGYCRLLQAYAPDLVCSYFAFDMALVGFFAQRLLGVPWLAFLEGRAHKPSLRDLLPTVLRAASGHVVADAGLLAHLAAQIGEENAVAAVMRRGAGGAAPAALARRLLAYSGPQRAVEFGVRAALTTKRSATDEVPARPRPFVIVGAERTGSNLLVGAIASQPQVACVGELFNLRFLDDGTVPWLAGSDTPEVDLHRLRATGARGLHRRLLAEAEARGVECVGFKLLYYQGLADHRILDYLAAVPNLKVIHLRRRDRLRRWVSQVQAERSDSWYVGAGEAPPVDSGPTALDIGKTIRDFERMELAEDLYAGLFPAESTLSLEYEELVADPAGVAARLGAFLGVRLDGFATRSRRTGAARLEDRVTNLEEVREALQGTRWKHLLPADQREASA